jgi:hypothetical protein
VVGLDYGKYIDAASLWISFQNQVSGLVFVVFFQPLLEHPTAP